MVGKDNFTYAEQPIPEPGDGQVLVRNLYLSFDPTQRGWMEDRESLAPVALGEPMRAGSIGQVVESHHAEFAVGDIVEQAAGRTLSLQRRARGLWDCLIPDGVRLK